MTGSKRTTPARPDRCLPESQVAALQMRGDSDALAQALAALGGHRSPEAPFRTPMGLQRLARTHRSNPSDHDRRPVRKPVPIINRAETGAAIDRTMEALKAVKGQLKAKKLNASALNDLMRVAMEELRAIFGPINDQYHADLQASIDDHLTYFAHERGECER